MKTSRLCNCVCGCGYLVIPGEFSASEDGCCVACLGGLHSAFFEKNRSPSEPPTGG